MTRLLRVAGALAVAATAAIVVADDASPFAGFIGSWTGKWRDGSRPGPPHLLTIEKIEGRSAELIYVHHNLEKRGAPREGGSGRATGTFADDGTLQARLVNGANVTYRLADDGQVLIGEYRRESFHFDGRFTRAGPAPKP